MKNDSITDGQRIYNSIHRKLCKPLYWTLLIVCIALITAVICDTCSIIRGTAHSGGTAGTLNEFYDTLVSITTIFAAAVIFFYSIQDYKKGGISNRTILDYTIGPLAIPIFFILTIILLPVISVTSHIGMGVTSDVSMILAYFCQMIILIFILLSNYYKFRILVICNVEWKQYRELCDLDRKKEIEKQQEKERKEKGKNSDDKQKLEVIWTYLIHHMEQVIISEEQVADQMELLRRILGTPFYEIENYKCVKMHLAERKNPNSYIMHMSTAYLKKNSLRRIYEFYYDNFSGAMSYLKRKENIDTRRKVYLVIYEFLDRLAELYRRSDRSRNACENYQMAVTGIMSAALENEMEDAEGFCNHILNKCMPDKIVCLHQIGLYFLLQEYFYRTPLNDSCAVNDRCLRDVAGINNITDWEMNIEYEEEYWKFWKIWMEKTTIEDSSKWKYFQNAISILKGEKHYGSDPLIFIMLLVNRAKENS